MELAERLSNIYKQITGCDIQNARSGVYKNLKTSLDNKAQETRTHLINCGAARILQDFKVSCNIEPYELRHAFKCYDQEKKEFNYDVSIEDLEHWSYLYHFSAIPAKICHGYTEYDMDNIQTNVQIPSIISTLMPGKVCEATLQVTRFNIYVTINPDVEFSFAKICQGLELSVAGAIIQQTIVDDQEASE